MSRFNFPIADVAAGQEIFPADTYNFELGEVKAFEGKEKEDGSKAYGIRMRLKIVSEGPHKNKGLLMSNYMHNEISQQMTKRFIMAVLGYNQKDEKAFDEAYAAKDWGFDTETGEVGAVYKELEGKIVTGELAIGVNKQTGNEQQNFKKWMVFGA